MKKFYSALPTRYARSLYQAAKHVNAVSEVEQDLQNLDEIFRTHNEFTTMIMNPALQQNVLSGILKSLGSKMKLSVVTSRFLELLVEKGRLELLPSIPLPFHRLWLEHQGIVEVKVTTAVPINDTIQKQITEHLTKQSGKVPVVSWSQKPDILGGLVIEWPDRIYDGSLARKLESLKSRMVEAV